MLDPITTNTERKKALSLHEASSGQTYVKDLNCLPVFSKNEAIELINYGLSGLESKPTNNNKSSSRGHACIFLFLTNLTNKSMSRNLLVDLAGVERFDKVTEGCQRQNKSSRSQTSLQISTQICLRCAASLNGLQGLGQTM